MAYNFLDKTGLALVWEKIKTIAAGKVDKVDGKGLSTNDYTSEEKTKLANVASGAQVNVLEGIQKNGSTITPVNKIANISVPTATSELTNDSGFITTSDIPEGAAASTTTPLMDGTAAVGTELAFARGDHRHPTDTSRASASDLTALTGRVSAVETAIGDGGSIDDRIEAAIQDLDSSVAATSNQAIASVTITDGKITASTKATIPTNNNQLTNGAGYQTASDVQTAIAAAQVGAALFQGTVNNNTTISGSAYKRGWYWVVATAGTYVGQTCEVGDMIFAVADKGASYSADDFSVVQNNLDLVAITSSEINTICV